jgi:hypothetical protein
LLPRLELVVDDADATAIHTAHLTLVPAHPGILSVDLLRDGRHVAQGMSRHSLRVWGAFAPEATVSVGSASALEVVATTSDGQTVAGPLALTPEQPWLTVQW